jgi:hypothetical protein
MHRPFTPTFVATPADASGAAFRLATYTGLILFFELAWIRYTSGYVRVFGFYQNFVLIATFLGMGVGLLRAASAARLKWLLPPVAVALLGAVAAFSAARIAVPNDKSEFIWGIFGNAGTHSIPLIVVVAVLFSLLALFFVPLGALVGEQFRRLPPLRAYAADIAGSLAGILAFGALSALRQPPIVWLAIGFAALVAASIRDRRFVLVVGAAGAAVLALASWTNRMKPEFWSPYYRINLLRRDDGGFTLLVNGSLHQIMLPLDSVHAAVPNSYIQQVLRAYERPYHYAARLDTALVVGAGTGNDLAVLLKNGAEYIDAVEIDPVIADIGAAGHPKQPYSDPRVHRHVNDARAFLRTTQQHYNVIVFGTLDSQTLLSGMSSVRLDNYVYTVESFVSARARLKPDGTLIAYHMSANPAIGAKLYQMIGEAFGEPPGTFLQHDGLFNLTFVAGHGARDVPALNRAAFADLTQRTERPHDDWPYLYLTGRTIPAHYIAALVVLLAISALFMGVGARRSLSGRWDAAMFFMGAGFLLVETKSVTEMSLLFGSTWTVNLMVFAAILVMVLIANLVVQRREPKRTAPLFVALFATLAIAYLIPASALLPLGTVAQWGAGALMVALPILFASLIFSTLLARRGDAARALAYNLLGAILGGVLEYSAMALGIKAMYIVAAVLYAAAAIYAVREEPILRAAV